MLVTLELPIRQYVWIFLLHKVRLVTVITSYVIALSAPSTLKRCRPLGALTQQDRGFEKQADLRRTPFDARQGCEHRDSFIDRLRRMHPYLRFNGVPMRIEQALWAMEMELFQRFHTACVIQL